MMRTLSRRLAEAFRPARVIAVIPHGAHHYGNSHDYSRRRQPGRSRASPPLAPAALFCLEEDFEALIAHLRLPVAHRWVSRTTKLLERLVIEERWRLKFLLNGFG
jgi:hypothetical protein